jgi:hypothetical protein
MGIINNKFRFGTIAGTRPGITNFPFPYFNHLKYFPGLPETIIKKLNIKIKK